MKPLSSTGLKILVLSKDMAQYRAAYYQEDFLRQLANQAECFFYGPGFPDYRLGETVSTVLKNSSFVPDLILTAHSFLEDNPHKPLEGIPGLRLESSSIPIFAVLNKEYSRLSEKISFFSNIQAPAIYTHHHNLEHFIGEIDIPYLFFPFGVDPKRFSWSNREKLYDLGFTGLLKNQTFSETQVSTREELMEEIYFSLKGTPLWKKKKYSHLRIIWKSWTGKPAMDTFGRILGHGKLAEEKYVSALRSTKVWINAPSPLGIISTRYFECMASGSFILAQDSPGLEKVFPRHLMATFGDISEFSTALEKTLSDETSLAELSGVAREFVLQNHTWKVRVGQMLESMSELLR